MKFEYNYEQTMEDYNDYKHICLFCKNNKSKDYFGYNECFFEDMKITMPDNGSNAIIECNKFKFDYKYKYDLYISTSKHWQEIRKQAMKRDNYQCKMCGTGKNANIVHHTTYDRLFNENIDDVITLCNKCHTKIHENDFKGE